MRELVTRYNDAGVGGAGDELPHGPVSGKEAVFGDTGLKGDYTASVD